MDKEKKIFLIKAIAVGVAALVLIGIVLAFVRGLQPGGEPSEPDVIQGDISRPTEETLPPPPANPYFATDFSYGVDGYLHLTAGKSVVGVDVSEHQVNVDWQAVKDSGVEFVIIRVGYRGYETGELYADTEAQTHYEGAKAAGLKIGAYFFSQALNDEEAAAEAAFTLEQIKDWQIDMPVVFDWEYVSSSARTANIGKTALTSATRVFCEAVKAAGYTPMLYFSQAQGDDLLELSELTEYGFWLAMYRNMVYPYRIDMWQYTSTGTVPGIDGEADIDLYFPEG